MTRKRKINIGNGFFGSDRQIRWSILVAVTILFTLILYPGLGTEKHTYHVGDVADRDIKAPIDFQIEDREATEARGLQAAEAIRTVYDHDTMLVARLSMQVESAFDNLRVVSEAKNATPADKALTTGTTPPTAPSEPEPTIHQKIQQLKGMFENRIGISVSNGAYRILEREKFPSKISDLITTILTEILDNGVVNNKEILLREAGKGIKLRDIETREERVVYNPKLFYGLDQAKTMVRIIGEPLLKNTNYTLRNLVVDFTQQIIEPNITMNRSETEERKKRAAEDIEPVEQSIKAGEMLIREGERVTLVKLSKLTTLQAHTKKGNQLPRAMAAVAIFLALLITTYILNVNRHSQLKQNPNRNLLFIASTLIVFFFIARISASLSTSLAQNALFSIPASAIAYGIPLSAGAMIICLFIGIDLALPIALVIAAGATIIFKNRFDMFIYFFLSGTMAAYWMRDCRERKVFVKTGVKIGLLNLAIAMTLDVYMADALDVYMADLSGVKVLGAKMLWDGAFAFLGGVSAGIVAAGLTPLIEISFGYMTDIKLLELANLDRPILRRLMLEAPGTYHHSVILGTMAEAAASDIEANPALAKVCGYYHDIGKINKPLYFIENQTDGNNKHNRLAPSMSKHILISHVRDGVEIAKENKLGQDILDTIRQHHGTSVIRYFYEKAKKLQGAESVRDQDYRYPGPKPQSNEAGLILLADVVEASSRTLDNPTPARIQRHVQALIYDVFSQGQLDHCDLTLKDLNAIAKNFIKILNGIHHHRIEYAENGASEKENGKNGSSDRKQAERVGHIVKENSDRGADHFRRLGLS